MGIKALLQMIGLFVSLFIFCSTSFAETLDPRWEYVGTKYGDAFYYDTQTLEYDQTNRVVKFWVLQINTIDQSKMETRNELSFKTKE